MPEIRIEPFDRRRHLRSTFQCGTAALDDFIRRFAAQYEKRKLGQTFVAVSDDGLHIIGFYTLSASAVAFGQLPLDGAKKLPKHPVPTVLLARPAVDQNFQGRGIGETLLQNALQRALEVSKSLGVFAVEVLAINDRAIAFYAKYGFTSLLDDARHMYLPISFIESIR